MHKPSWSKLRVAGTMLLGASIFPGGPAWADDRPGPPSPPAATAAAAPARTPPAEASAARDAQRRALVLMILKTSGGPFGFLR